MIRFDQRQFDVQGTEKVFKKVVHPGQNIRLVDKDGIPLKAPNSSSLSRLQSQYVVSPRGVPTKRSNHSYSGQLAQSKLHSVVNSLDTSTQPDMMSYSSVHNYNGLSSAQSSQNYHSASQRYMPGNLTPKKRAFGSGPPRSVKSMPIKSASTQRSRFLTSAATTLQTSTTLPTSTVATTTDEMSGTDFDADKTNDSPQGKRLEKEWSALSSCRALKRSSEIVSHRVDRMYFMTGSKLRLQSKYHVEEDDLKHLRELTQARATSRATRFGGTRKGDIYDPDMSTGGSEKDDASEKQVNGIEGEKAEMHKMNGKKKPPGPPESPIIKHTRASKSPIAGWAGAEIDSKDPSVANEIVHNKILHEDVVDGAEDDAINGAEKTVNGAGNTVNGAENTVNRVENTVNRDVDDTDNGNKENIDNANITNNNNNQTVEPDKTENHQHGEQENTADNVEENVVSDVNGDNKLVTPANVSGVDEPVSEMGNGGESVQEDSVTEADGDKTVVKSEDYLDSVDA